MEVGLPPAIVDDFGVVGRRLVVEICLPAGIVSDGGSRGPSVTGKLSSRDRHAVEVCRPAIVVVDSGTAGIATVAEIQCAAGERLTAVADVGAEGAALAGEVGHTTFDVDDGGKASVAAAAGAAAEFGDSAGATIASIGDLGDAGAARVSENREPAGLVNDGGDEGWVGGYSAALFVKKCCSRMGIQDGGSAAQALALEDGRPEVVVDDLGGAAHALVAEYSHPEVGVFNSGEARRALVPEYCSRVQRKGIVGVLNQSEAGRAGFGKARKAGVIVDDDGSSFCCRKVALGERVRRGGVAAKD